MEKFEGKVEKEKGKNVKIVIKFIRHGERDKEGNLLDLGREITAKRANESGIKKDDFDVVKAYGSNAKPDKTVSGMGRALETADIYTHEIAGDEQFTTRVNDILNYETLINPAPYDHREVYDANLPENFDELMGDEKIEAAKKAQTAVVNHLINLNTPEAIEYKKEIAGSYAHIIKHYEKMASKFLNSDSKVLIVAGTHGGMMEFVLQQALIREKNGEKLIGFEDINDVGGEFDPSDSFDVDVATNEQGKIKDFTVRFDNHQRPQESMKLDVTKLEELASYYEELHK